MYIDVTKEQKNALLGSGEKRLVILSLDSFSSAEINAQLKEEIYIKLSSKYVILENSPKFTYPEIFAIATKAKMLVALRSGLVDFLINSGIETYLYYTDFIDRGFNTPSRSSDEVLKLFSIKSIPLSNAMNSREDVLNNLI